MTVVFVGWFFFRVTSWEVFTGTMRAFGNWTWAPAHGEILVALTAVCLTLGLLEWVQRRKGDFVVTTMPRWAADAGMSCLVLLCLVMSRQHQSTFIYFQF